MPVTGRLKSGFAEETVVIEIQNGDPLNIASIRLGDPEQKVGIVVVGTGEVLMPAGRVFFRKSDRLFTLKFAKPTHVRRYKVFHTIHILDGKTECRLVTIQRKDDA